MGRVVNSMLLGYLLCYYWGQALTHITCHTINRTLHVILLIEPSSVSMYWNTTLRSSHNFFPRKKKHPDKLLRYNPIMVHHVIRLVYR